MGILPMGLALLSDHGTEWTGWTGWTDPFRSNGAPHKKRRLGFPSVRGPATVVPMKERLDILVQHQAGISRSRAQGMILTGMVFSREGEKLDKPGLRLPPDTILEIREEPRFVSRGGEKLDAAMEAFHLDVTGKVAIDVGASTGGFTDCMLQRGVARVYAVDVGYGQLAWKLRQDPRVVVMERTNARRLEPGIFPERPEFFAADCSFISLRLVLQPLRGILARHAEGVVLVKPQFEAGRELVGKGGVVRDESVHQQVLEDIGAAARQLGFSPGPVIPSPLLGPAGNREFLMHLSLEPEPPRPS